MVAEAAGFGSSFVLERWPLDPGAATVDFGIVAGFEASATVEILFHLGAVGSCKGGGGGGGSDSGGGGGEGEA